MFSTQRFLIVIEFWLKFAINAERIEKRRQSLKCVVSWMSTGKNGVFKLNTVQ